MNRTAATVPSWALGLWATGLLVCSLVPALSGCAPKPEERRPAGQAPCFGPRPFTFPHPCRVFVEREEDGQWSDVARFRPGETASIPRCYVWVVAIDVLEPSWTWARLAEALQREGVPGLQAPETRTDADVACLAELEQLRWLDLSVSNPSRSITDAGLRHVAELVRLRTLGLRNCAAVTEAGLACLKNLGDLRRLDLGGCHGITDAGLAHLESVCGLRTLSK